VTLSIANCPSNIKVHNSRTRFESLGDKRNHIATLAHGDYLCIWDDDDLYLPHRIEASLQLIQNTDYDIVKAKYSYVSVDNKDYRLSNHSLFHSQACITKDYMKKTKYPNITTGEDLAFEEKAKVYWAEVAPWYIYRWGLNIHHASGLQDQRQAWDRTLTWESYQKLKGNIVLKPQLRHDYWKEIS
jgi:glycosyltransferase involved in cell wall biosynthesis